MVRVKGDRCHKENTVSSMTDRPINSETVAAYAELYRFQPLGSKC